MKILQICPRVPYPPHDGGAIAMYDVVKNLSDQGHDVTVLAINTPKHFQENNVIEEIANLVTVFVDTRLSPYKAFLNLFSDLPYNIERFISKDVENKLIELLQKESFDIVQIEGSLVASYVDVVKQNSDVPVVMRSHNVEYLIWERLAKNEKNPLKRAYLGFLAKRIQNFEKKYFDKFDSVVAITETDKKRIQEFGCKARLEFIPAGVELANFKKTTEHKPKNKTLFNIGSLNWLPNLEGLQWFFDFVWKPAVKEMPGLELHLAGKSAPNDLLQLNLPNLTMHGFVDSASDFMQQYDLMIVPLLSGGGMRIKIIEGMALGKCILTTSVGCEGILCTNKKDILISDRPEDWLNILREYYYGRINTAEIGRNAEALIQQKYDNKLIIKRFEDLYQSLKK